MAQRMVHEFLAAYSSCCAVAALLLLQPAAGMAVVGVAGGGPRGTIAADAVAGVVVPVASSATRNKRWSTTFGGNSSNKNATVNNAVQDCTTDSDCLDTPFTSCALDPSDKKRKCLCADGKQPLNGDCLKKPRALRTSCETDVECLPNAICKNNATLTNPRLKICACKDGYTEEKDSCNYADLLNFNYLTLFIAVFTSLVWNDHRA
ncbi:PREDICTED: uncharacterized protein LOC107162246 isoform X2 [Diuraphis noxia]|uniref:uncharacterized protein LOC107162246 isoform X2 n=1 Tax=Diuraphis noxia TaxID=143948 RepID=UPI000763A96A|nr:PREDICTED: uncharacterized protein LOC107162246 isoform X2 [Diuraphis noxia]